MRRGWRLDEDLGSGDWRDEDWGRLIGPTKIWTTGTWTQQGVQKAVFLIFLVQNKNSNSYGCHGIIFEVIISVIETSTSTSTSTLDFVGQP